jgi:hypothetical protein
MMITEADVDFVAEIEAADAEALEDWEAKRSNDQNLWMVLGEAA